jgi:hypothetical protein
VQPKSPAALKSATAALAEKAEKLYEDGRHSEIYALLKSAVDEARDNTFMRRCSRGGRRAVCRTLLGMCMRFLPFVMYVCALQGEAGADVLWRLARACYEKGVASANNADKKKFYEDGLKCMHCLWHHATPLAMQRQQLQHAACNSSFSAVSREYLRSARSAHARKHSLQGCATCLAARPHVPHHGRT